MNIGEGFDGVSHNCVVDALRPRERIGQFSICLPPSFDWFHKILNILENE
jgi:hypothetical protein